MNTFDLDFWNLLDELVRSTEIVIDRPKGSAHPRYPEMIYEADYGYLKGTASMDGGGIDVWIGTGGKEIDAVICTVDIVKKDSEIITLFFSTGKLHRYQPSVNQRNC